MVEDQFDRQGHRRAYKGQAAVLDEAGDDDVPGGQTDLRALFRTMVAYTLPSTFSVRSLSSKPPNQICEPFGSSQNHEAYPVADDVGEARRQDLWKRIVPYGLHDCD